ncbi:MAG: transcriptional regulator [Aliihoeflea sp.]
MPIDTPVLALNLRQACATMPSVSHFCRTHGFNRQQFNRYISGQSRPSPYNLARIAHAFQLDPVDFERGPEEFRVVMARRRVAAAAPAPPLDDAFPGDIAELRRYLGFYQTWHVSLSWPGQVVCSCTHLREHEGKVAVTSLERIEDAASGIRQRSRYDGLAAYRRGRIFVTERTRGDAPTFGQTIMLPLEIHQRLYLRGLTMGISWRKDNQPYASRMIWRFDGTHPDLRKLLGSCGTYDWASAQIPSVVAGYLSEAQPLTAG